MKCIAIDDEPIALEVLTRFCQRLGDIELLTFTHPLKGIEQVKRQMPDILFLDIELGGLNGVDLARELPTCVSLIFTTAYAEYAIDGFELNAVDFLHKPFFYSRFEKAVRKTMELRTLQNFSNIPAQAEESITVKVEYKNTNIKLNDILYIESMDNYVRIYLVEKGSVLSQMSMKNIQELLPSDKFIRVHKSFIVPVYRIASYTRKQVVLYNNKVIPVGRTFLKEVYSRL